jgi:hypothetical protein
MNCDRVFCINILHKYTVCDTPQEWSLTIALIALFVGLLKSDTPQEWSLTIALGT